MSGFAEENNCWGWWGELSWATALRERPNVQFRNEGRRHFYVALWKYHISSWGVYPDGAASGDFWHMAATSVCQVLVLCSSALLKWLIWLVAAWKLCMCVHTKKSCVTWPSFTPRQVREDVSAPCQMLLTEMSKQHSQVVWWLSLQGFINSFFPQFPEN